MLSVVSKQAGAPRLPSLSAAISGPLRRCKSTLLCGFVALASLLLVMPRFSPNPCVRDAAQPVSCRFAVPGCVVPRACYRCRARRLSKGLPLSIGSLLKRTRRHTFQ
ncbi:hypothetical protein TRVL_09408 [Trypanosoma vivax]|nr:hypothetical protein TRVL_09408 [Trypanosoma vivax]